ncbi:T9SS type A sorting domain-containing protein [Pontibacter sp. G13]|uniref:T9SS type A sorting domain-containing protein n=1 Tax=Pontibacter sp. G13 TaxID=3074898 RepID=UPI00288A609F|nr:T9SS type A sorting domain-containing protein [Pontibacter sp. G13]WNJ20428.1 T9SS type A sorting domain-containing protein [Pontibacter sp. G13]
MKRLPHLMLILIMAVGAVSLPKTTSAQGTVTIAPKTQRFIGGVSRLDRSKYITFHGYFGANSTDPELVSFRNTYNLAAGYDGGRRAWSPLNKTDDDLAGTIPNVQDKYEGIRSVDGTVATGRADLLMHNPNIDYSTTDITQRIAVVTDYVARSFKDEWDDCPTFYEPFNEPMIKAPDFYPGGFNTAKNDIIITRICEFHREMGAAIHAYPELQNIQMIGYASAYPEFEKDDFTLWQKRYKKFIDIAGPEMDGFSIHLYDGVGVNNSGGRRSGSNMEALLDMIEAYSFEKLGVVKPIAVTEFGRLVESQPGWVEGGTVGNYEPVENSQAVRSQNHMVMSFMERAGNMSVAIPFSVGKTNPFNDKFSRASLWVEQPDGSYLLTQRRFYYEIWKDVAGDRVEVQSSNIDVQTQAFVSGEKLYLVLNNLNDSTQTVNLNLLTSSGLQEVHTKRLKIFVDQIPQLTESTDSIAPSNLTINYGETVVLTYTYDSPIEFDRSIQGQKYYANLTLKPISANTNVAFTIEDVETDTAGYAFLRVGVGRAHGLSLNPTVTINGQSVSYTGDIIKGYDQNTRTAFFGILEIPVDLGVLQTGANAVNIQFPDGGGHISSVSLQVRTYGEPVIPEPGPIVTFQNLGSFRYMSAGNSSQMNTVDTAGVTEEFELVDFDGGMLLDGQVALKGNNGLYVSSEDGAQELTCESTTIGQLELFELVDQGDGSYAIKGSNGLYLRENMLCNSANVSTWQKWTITGLPTPTSLDERPTPFKLFPNPWNHGTATMEWHTAQGPYSLRILDLQGKEVFRASDIVGSIQIPQSAVKNQGVYIVTVSDGKHTHHSKWVVKR